MRYAKTQDGGRSLIGDTPIGSFNIVAGPDGSCTHWEHHPHDSSEFVAPLAPGKRTVAGLVKGAAALIGNETGVGMATDEVRDQRYAICNGCEQNVAGMCMGKKCGGCYIPVMIRRNKEACPLKLWDAVTE